MTTITIGEVMTPDPITISADTALDEAQKLMISRRLRHLPVMDGERLMGVVSDRDIYLAQITNRDLDDFSSLQVGDVCSLDAYAVESNSTLAEVSSEMAKRQIGSALIVDGGKLSGIFTATDACRHLGRQLQAVG